MKVGINIDRSVEEVEVLITAQEQGRTVDALYEHIVGFDKKSFETLTVYKDDIVQIVNVTDIFRIYTGNQKVYIQTHQGEYAIRYRLYELEAILDKKQFLRISNSEIVNVKKIRDIDLSITGRICIRFADNTQTNARNILLDLAKEYLQNENLQKQLITNSEKAVLNMSLMLFSTIMEQLSQKQGQQ